MVLEEPGSYPHQIVILAFRWMPAALVLPRQVTFDPSHRFVSEEDPPEPIMSSQFQADGPKEGRKDIDQALSLLQLSGGSSGSQVGRSGRPRSGGGSLVGG